MNERGFNHVLTESENNDPLEDRLSTNRYIGGKHLASYVPTFICNDRALVLRLISQLFTNPDGSHNKLLCKSFFLDTHSMLETSERL